jgi:hypothetical protein
MNKMRYPLSKECKNTIAFILKVDPESRPSIEDILRYGYIQNMCRKFKWNLAKLMKFKMISNNKNQLMDNLKISQNEYLNESFNYQKMMSGFSFLNDCHSREQNTIKMNNDKKMIKKKNNESDHNIVLTNKSENKLFFENMSKLKKNPKKITTSIARSSNTGDSGKSDKLNFSSFTDQNNPIDTSQEVSSSYIIKISNFI